MEKGKTSTFTIHHDRCDPHKWTARDFITFGDFVRTGSLQNAAALSRLGMQLVLSDMHEPKGGTLEEIGWAKADESINDSFTDDLGELCDDDLTPIVRVYRGPTEYAVRYGIGDGEGNFEGWEHDVKATEAEAVALLSDVNEEIERSEETPRVDAP